jgi:hypothetical protein
MGVPLNGNFTRCMQGENQNDLAMCSVVGLMLDTTSRYFIVPEF